MFFTGKSVITLFNSPATKKCNLQQSGDRAKHTFPPRFRRRNGTIFQILSRMQGSAPPQFYYASHHLVIRNSEANQFFLTELNSFSTHVDCWTDRVFQAALLQRYYILKTVKFSSWTSESTMYSFYLGLTYLIKKSFHKEQHFTSPHEQQHSDFYSLYAKNISQSHSHLSVTQLSRKKFEARKNFWKKKRIYCKLYIIHKWSQMQDWETA